jgi:vacuolar protein sorting-associated protein IST1
MAELLADKKLESARIRVENIIRSDITTELHEMLELYCELLLARIQLLDAVPTASSSSKKDEKDSAQAYEDVDPGLLEAVRALVFAAPKTEIKELGLARALLVDKFGKDFALECQAGTKVPERVLTRLRVETPNPKLVEEYLREIARTYGVHFPGDPETEEEEDEDIAAEDGEEDADPGDDDDGEGGAKNKSIALENPWQQAEELSRATPPRDDLGRPSPLRIAPPSPTTENVSPAVKLPRGDGGAKSDGGVVRAPPVAGRKTSVGGVKGTAGGAKKESSGARAKSTAKAEKEREREKTDGPGGKIPDVDELAKRFAALKRT